MKKQKVAEIDNVKKSMQCVHYLLNRPKSEMVGLGLFYGAPGLGKTRFVKRYAIQHNYIYLRLEATTTPKTFAKTLYRALSYRYNLPSRNVRGSANKIFNACIEILTDAPNMILFIDEIDYAFKNKQLLGSIRDIVDETYAIVILVGMQNAKSELLKANAHYFDRTNFIVQFKRLSRKDVKKVCNEIADIELDTDVIDLVNKTTKGTLRKIIKMVHALEQIAEQREVKRLSYKDVEGVFE